MQVRSSSLPPSSSSPPPLAPFLWLYEASSTLAAGALMSGPSARADWPDARVRESGSRVWLSSYSGNRASNPREGQGSGARGRAWVPPPPRTVATPSSAAARLASSPLSFPGSPGPGEQASNPRPSPRSALPPLATDRPPTPGPQVTATSRSREEANLRRLVTKPRAPSPLFTATRGGGDGVPAPSPPLALRPPAHNFL